MTTFHGIASEANIARLNAFLDQFQESIDPEFDGGYEDLNREFAPLRDLNDGGAYA
ncbi:MAG: hypothetical protein ACREJM_11080 [Candidatus Saccharimonadales bacterium]